jgi:hypothetical protein
LTVPSVTQGCVVAGIEAIVRPSLQVACTEVRPPASIVRTQA